MNIRETTIPALVALALLTVACGTETNNSVDYSTNSGVVWEKISTNNYVTELTRLDGTRCIIWDGPRAGGLSCDFTRDTDGY